MFVRLKKVPDRRGGHYQYLQIVRSERVGSKVRQRVLCTLGRLEQLMERGEIEGLVRSLQRYLPG